MMRINLGEIDLDIHDCTTGVMVSGGCDSAILLYILALYSQHPVHVFSLHNNSKHGNNTHASVNLVAEISKRTQNRNIIHHIAYVDEQTKENLFEYPETMLETGLVDIFYTGITANPPKAVTDAFASDIPSFLHDVRNPAINRPVYDSEQNWYAPWTNINKQDIAQFYEHFGVTEWLLPLTRSCEWVPSMAKKIPEPNGLDHCGGCWWCQERDWGFEKVTK